MAGTIDTVCFDLDDTLCTYRRPGGDVLDLAFDRAGVEPLWTITDYYGLYREHLEAGTDVDDIRRRCFVELAVDAGHDRETGRVVADAFAEIREPAGVDPLPGARDVLDTLAGEYRLGLVTNGPPKLQRAKLEAIDAAETFDTVVCAGFDTAPKPAAEPFEVALDALESTPERAVYVGNSLSSDVAGARAAGLQSVWIPHTEDVPDQPEPAPEYTFDRLEALATPPW